MRHDGEIVIKSKIDTSGFNKDLDNIDSGAEKSLTSIGAKLSKIGQSFAALGRAIALIVKVAIIGAIAAAIIAVTGLIAVIALSAKELFKMDGYANALKDRMAQLRVSFASAFRPLIDAAIPYIIKVVDWLINLFNTVQMVTAALMGQKTIMLATAASTGAASEGAAELAKNTEKAGKAAKGALAAFDQLNVLQMNKPTTTSTGNVGVGTGGGVTFKEVPISPEILGKIEKAKADIAATVDNVARNIPDLSYKTVSAWFENMKKKLAEWVEQSKKEFGNFWGAGGAVSQWLESSKNSFIGMLRTWGANWYNTWYKMKMDLGNVWAGIKKDFLDPLWNGFVGVLRRLKSAWDNTWYAIYLSLRSLSNGIIGLFNKMILGVVEVLNTISRAAQSVNINIPSINYNPIPSATSSSIPSKPSSPYTIPMAAKGVVIPPNSKFAAILGDQKSGTNLETPESLLRQIFQEELKSMKTEITINFSGSLAALVRELKPYIDKENIRIGSSLATRSTP